MVLLTNAIGSQSCEDEATVSDPLAGVVDRHLVIQTTKNQTIEISRSGAHIDSQTTRINETIVPEDLGTVNQTMFNESQVSMSSINTNEVKEEEINEGEAKENQTVTTESQKESQALKIDNHGAMNTGDDHVKESLLISTDDEMMYQELDFSTGGVSIHLGLIADSMYEWEGSVAEQLNLTQSDIAAIKKKHPNDLHLQT